MIPPSLLSAIMSAQSTSVNVPPLAEPDEVEGLAQDAGFRTLVVNGSGVASKAELIDAFARDLAFPGWVAHNWDALLDALRDLSWLKFETAAMVRVANLETLAEREVIALGTLSAVLADAAASWRRRSPLPVVFVLEDPHASADDEQVEQPIFW